MELRQILNIMWKWAWLAILAVVIASTTSYFASKATTPLYRTTTTMMIGAAIQDPNPNDYQIYTSQQLAYTYIQLAGREPVLSGVIKDLGLNMSWEQLAGQVSASSIPNTQLLEVTVVDVDPYRAKVLADEIAQQLILQGPASSGETSPEQVAFAQKQLDDLKSKIESGQNDLTKLNQDLDAANSARQIQDLQSQVTVLQNKISDWQNTYAQLLLSVKGGSVNSLSVVEPAVIPTYPFSPNTRRNVLVAAAIGLALSVLGVTLIEYFDDTIKTQDDFTRITGLPALGAIAQIDGNNYPDKLLAMKQPLSPIVEAYRSVRTNLQFSFLDKPMRSLILTSPGPAEGKSITLANLATVIAQSGRKVIIVDADLRRPVQHKIFGVTNRIGLTDALLHAVPFSGLPIESMQPESDPTLVPVGKEDPIEVPATDHVKVLLETLKPQPKVTNPFQMDANAFESVQPVTEFLQSTAVENLRLLSTGPLPPNPSELMGSERMAHLLELLKAEADLVLVDSPPMLLVTDATILGLRVDGTIMVVDSGRTRAAATRRAVEELRKGHINLVGGVINRMTRQTGGYYYYYYYYHYYDQESARVRGKKRHQNNKRLINQFTSFFSRHSNHRDREK